MDITLVLVGIGCIIGAIVGGSFKLTQVMEMGRLESLWRQLLLGAFGACLVFVGLVRGGGISLPSSSSDVSERPERNTIVAAPTAPPPSPNANVPPANVTATAAEPTSTSQSLTPMAPTITDGASGGATASSGPATKVETSGAATEDPTDFDYTGPWLDQYQQRVAIMQNDENITLQWHGGNQTVRIVGTVDERGQFFGESDVANRRSCSGGFYDGSRIGIVCRGDPGINNWTFRLLRVSS